MKCPRCKTENGTRTICSKCGYFMYHPDIANRQKMTKGQQAVADTKIVGKKVGKASAATNKSASSVHIQHTNYGMYVSWC